MRNCNRLLKELQFRHQGILNHEGGGAECTAHKYIYIYIDIYVRIHFIFVFTYVYEYMGAAMLG